MLRERINERKYTRAPSTHFRQHSGAIFFHFAAISAGWHCCNTPNLNISRERTKKKTKRFTGLQLDIWEYMEYSPNLRLANSYLNAVEMYSTRNMNVCLCMSFFHEKLTCTRGLGERFKELFTEKLQQNA